MLLPWKGDPFIQITFPSDFLNRKKPNVYTWKHNTPAERQSPLLWKSYPNELGIKHEGSGVSADDASRFSFWSQAKYIEGKASIAGWVKLVKLLSLGGFELSQISSCSREVLSRIHVSHRGCTSHTLDFDSDELLTERTLGLQWDCETDSFKFLLNNTALPFAQD